MTPDQIQAWVGALGGRRFLMAIGCGLITTILCWCGKIGGDVYATVILGTVGTYIGANTWQKGKGMPDNPPTVYPPDTPAP